jgi:hypothetical protein
VKILLRLLSGALTCVVIAVLPITDQRHDQVRIRGRHVDAQEFLPDVLDGTIRRGKVFDRTVSLDEVPDGCRAMAARDALKVIAEP